MLKPSAWVVWIQQQQQQRLKPEMSWLRIHYSPRWTLDGLSAKKKKKNPHHLFGLVQPQRISQECRVKLEVKDEFGGLNIVSVGSDGAVSLTAHNMTARLQPPRPCLTLIPPHVSPCAHIHRKYQWKWLIDWLIDLSVIGEKGGVNPAHTHTRCCLNVAKKTKESDLHPWLRLRDVNKQ